jgi:hypothetical protein
MISGSFNVDTAGKNNQTKILESHLILVIVYFLPDFLKKIGKFRTPLWEMRTSLKHYSVSTKCCWFLIFNVKIISE